MAEDSFRGSCINCGTPTPPGTPCLNCQAALVAKVRGETGRVFTPVRYPRVVASIPTKGKQMNGVQVCERCGSIGQSRDFVSISANNMAGISLHMPELVTPAQLEKLQEDDTELEFQSNATICRNCKTALVSFFHNLPTESGSAGAIQPRLPKSSESQSSGSE